MSSGTGKPTFFLCPVDYIGAGSFLPPTSPICGTRAFFCVRKDYVQKNDTRQLRRATTLPF